MIRVSRQRVLIPTGPSDSISMVSIPAIVEALFGMSAKTRNVVSGSALTRCLTVTPGIAVARRRSAYLAAGGFGRVGVVRRVVVRRVVVRRAVVAGFAAGLAGVDALPDEGLAAAGLAAAGLAGA